MDAALTGSGGRTQRDGRGRESALSVGEVAERRSVMMSDHVAWSADETLRLYELGLSRPPSLLTGSALRDRHRVVSSASAHHQPCRGD